MDDSRLVFAYGVLAMLPVVGFLSIARAAAAGRTDLVRMYTGLGVLGTLTYIAVQSLVL
jgi:hypothetical protein